MVLSEKVKNVYRQARHQQKKAWITYVMQVVRPWAVCALLLLNRVMTFFHNLG